jgi:hypothetical protein
MRRLWAEMIGEQVVVILIIVVTLGNLIRNSLVMVDINHMVALMVNKIIIMVVTNGIRIVIITMISNHKEVETDQVSLINKEVDLLVKLIVERIQQLDGKVNRIVNMVTGMLRVMRTMKMTSKILKL